MFPEYFFDQIQVGPTLALQRHDHELQSMLILPFGETRIDDILQAAVEEANQTCKEV